MKKIGINLVSKAKVQDYWEIESNEAVKWGRLLEWNGFKAAGIRDNRSVSEEEIFNL